jgi:hypothetical protein
MSLERCAIENTDDIREALVRVGEYAKIQRRAGQKRPVRRANLSLRSVRTAWYISGT